MIFTIGIDEAGYGPNLGPLVQAAVVCATAEHSELWNDLQPCVRRAGDPIDRRTLIDDSKLVHVGSRGLERLEETVVGAIVGHRVLGAWLEEIACGSTLEDLAGEPWYIADTEMPLALDRTTVDAESPGRFVEQLRSHGVEWTMVRTVVTPAGRFNALTAGADSKAAVLAHGLIALLAEIDGKLPGDRPRHFVIDKHGGRTFYAPMIQTAFPGDWVTTIEEGAECSRYRIERGPRSIELTFTPRADGASLLVALASMIAKYLREALMRQFNRFWQDRVPQLEATAGYPNDSKRFYGLIQRAMRELGIRESQVWRER